MISSYAFPGCILVLKLFFKVFVDQKPKWIDGFRAALAFPVDVTFLAFSYGAATLTFVTADKSVQPDWKMVAILTLTVIIGAFIATKLSRHSDASLDQANYFQLITCSVLSYLCAGFILYWSIHCERLV